MVLNRGAIYHLYVKIIMQVLCKLQKILHYSSLYLYFIKKNALVLLNGNEDLLLIVNPSPYINSIDLGMPLLHLLGINVLNILIIEVNS